MAICTRPRATRSVRSTIAFHPAGSSSSTTTSFRTADRPSTNSSWSGVLPRKSRESTGRASFGGNRRSRGALGRASGSAYGALGLLPLRHAHRATVRVLSGRLLGRGVDELQGGSREVAEYGRLAMHPLERAAENFFEVVAVGLQHGFPVLDFGGRDPSVILMERSLASENDELAFRQPSKRMVQVDVDAAAAWKIEAFVGPPDLLETLARAEKAVRLQKLRKKAAWVCPAE